MRHSRTWRQPHGPFTAAALIPRGRTPVVYHLMTSCGLPSLPTLTLGRRTDFVSSTVLRWCNASHIRAHSTTVVTPASPLRAWDASNSKGKKSPIYLLVQHWCHFFFLFNLQGGAQLRHLFLEEICWNVTRPFLVLLKAFHNLDRLTNAWVQVLLLLQQWNCAWACLIAPSTTALSVW